MAKLAAVLLAAGASSRFGAENKLLARIGDRPLVRCVAEETLLGGVAEVVVVTGCDAPLIGDALSGLPVRFVLNEKWPSGMGSSIAAGVTALDEGIEGAFIVPADMAFLKANLLLSLVSAFERHDGNKIIYPATPDGAQRNPVLWPRSFFPGLRTLSGQEGAKQLLQSLEGQSAALRVTDAAALADVDTRKELEVARALMRARDGVLSLGGDF